MSKIIENISFYLKNFYVQDFILLGLCFLIFIFILIIAIVLRRFPVFSLVLIVFCIVFEFAFYYFGNEYIEENYRPSKFEFIKNYKLFYSDNIYINYKFSNLSNVDFKICKITLSLQKVSKNRLEKIKNTLKPLKVIKITLRDIPAGKYEIKELLIPYKPKKYTIIPSIKCF